MGRGNRLILVFALILGACNPAHHTASFSPAVTLTKDSKFVVGDISSKVTFPPDVDYAKIWKKELGERLVERHIQASPGDPNAITIDAVITDYERGSAWLRWAAANFAGETRLAVDASLKQGGAEIATVRADQTVNCCGLYSAGAWSYVFENVAEQVVFEAEKKMGTDD